MNDNLRRYALSGSSGFSSTSRRRIPASDAVKPSTGMEP
jgi:hypothetical protein